jgi:hypothetical protein
MAYEFNFDEMFKWCALYLSKGMQIVRLHGIRPDGRCTCGDPECAVGRSSARSAGKHPVGLNWGENFARSEDDILAWDDGVPFNVGVVLGAGGGFIDNEDDTPEGKAFRESLGLHTLETPSWTSGRSTHQLTLWDERLAGISKAEPGGLECRVGGGGKQIQSVLPPSWHHSGVRYTWKSGLSIDDVEIAPTPRDLLVQIVNYSSGKVGSGGEYLGPLVFRVVHDGEGRHKALLLWAWNKIVNDRFPLVPERRSVLTKEIQDANDKYLVPPKAPKEVLAIVNSCFHHYRRKHDEKGWNPAPADLTEDAVKQEAESIRDTSGDSSSAATVAVSGFELHGLERYQVGSVEAYKPGDWSIQMIQSDPPEVVLIVPAWERTPCKGRIQMTFDTFRSAAKVASQVFLATRRVILDGDSAKWVACWKGMDASKKTNNQSVPGLMEQLVQRKNEEDDIQVGTSSLRYAQLASYVLQVFKKATQPKDEAKPEPNESGRPCWVTPDELWLQWGKIWEDIGRSHDVMPGERNRIRGRLVDMVGQRDFTHKRHQFASGRLEYVVFDQKWLAALERMAAGEDSLTVIDGNNGGKNSDFSKSECYQSVTPSLNASRLAAMV